MTLTGSLASKLLRESIKDYNYWGQSESDSPLAIKRTKSVMDDKRILSLDASVRRKAEQLSGLTETYKAPERTIRTHTLDEIFKPLVANALLELESKANVVKAGKAGIETLQFAAEQTEYYVQLYSVFNQLAEPKVCYVEDNVDPSQNDPYTGLFIIGGSSDGETVYAQGLLIQT